MLTSGEIKIGRLKIAMVSILLLFFLGASYAQDVAIIYQKGTALFEDTAQSVKALSSSNVFIPVEKDKEDEAKGAVSREKDSLICAIGPTAITLAFQSGSSKGVAVGLPNPLSKNFSAKKDFVFVSLYPEPKLVFDYLLKTAGAKSVGIIYTNSVNQEMADYFKSQAETAGFKCRMMGVNSPQDLTAPFSYFLDQVDAALLLIDPLAYNKDVVKFMVTKAIEKKKPIFGFSEQVASAGIPVAFFIPPQELSQTTARAIKEKKDNSSKSPVYFSSDFKLSVNKEAASVIGVKYDETKVVTRF
jgi:hypothetical protein